jgi:transposase
MNEHGIADEAFIYVADSAMVTDENLEQAGRFITRLPATSSPRDNSCALNPKLLRPGVKPCH